jgi:hypothetical protein
MRHLEIAKFCESNRVSRNDGARLREAIEAAWREGEQIALDFSNVRIASVSFFDESLGLLARDYSLDELKNKVSVEHLNVADRALLNKIVASRARERDANTRDSVTSGR